MSNRASKRRAKILKMRRNMDAGKHPNEDLKPNPETVQNLRCFLLPDGDGVPLQRRYTKTDPGPPWVELDLERDRDLMSRLNENPRALMLEADKREAFLRPEVRLTYDDPIFGSDGYDCLSVSASGVPEGADGLWVKVNGQRHLVERNSVLEIVTTEPGKFIIQADDKRFNCNPRELLAEAYKPEDIGTRNAKGDTDGRQPQS